MRLRITPEWRHALWAGALLGALIPSMSHAERARFRWEGVDDGRVAKYVLAWGTSPAASGGAYAKGSLAVSAPTTTATTPDLGPGQWYFAVKACTADDKLCSAWSNEVAVTMRGPIPVPPGLKLEALTFSLPAQ